MRITVRNVNGALSRAVALLDDEASPIWVAPRGSPTKEWPTPVMTTYRQPRERVLFWPARDANPFFHLFESLWMLAGRDDVAFPAGLVKRMAQFSDDGERLRGAYGRRWRSWFGRDQLDDLVAMLRREPETRRAVLSIWSPQDDLGADSRDVPCNTHAYLKVRAGALRMTVMCRSNDVLWGAYGANAVHFSMLQEYLADRVGVGVGPLYQLSDSWHAYVGGDGGALWERLRAERRSSGDHDLYTSPGIRPQALGVDDAWENDLRRFFHTVAAAGETPRPVGGEFKHPWWTGVALPMWHAWATRDQAPLRRCTAEDWRLAGWEWLERRRK